MQLSKSLMALVVAVGTSAPVSAAVIGFEGVAPVGGSVIPAVPYVESGFTFTSSLGSAPLNGIFDAAAPVNTNGTDIFGWCAADCSPAPQVITVTGPGSFSISSIDIGFLFPGSLIPGMFVNLTGDFSGGGSISTSLPVGALWATHVLVGFTGLSALRISAVDPGTGLHDSAIDNLALTPVPEPTSLLLLGTGLLAFGRRFAKRI